MSGRLGRLLGIDYGYHDPGIIGFGLDNRVAAIGDNLPRGGLTRAGEHDGRSLSRTAFDTGA